MSNIFKLLKMAFSIGVFFLAITFLYQMQEQFDKLASVSGERITGDNLVAETLPYTTDHFITKGELISYLMSELQYDLEIIDEIGTYVIECESYSPGFIQQYPLMSDKFEKTYNYFLNGNISKITFKYVS